MLLVILGGCVATTPRYVYQPAMQATAQASGYPAAHYTIPPVDPTGDVRVASFGFTEVQAQGGGPSTSVMHVRMIVANNRDDSPWTIDTREIVATVAGEGGSRPAFVNTDAGAPPIVQVSRGEQRIIDLYYPLPEVMSTEDRLPSFDVRWQVQTSGGAIAQRTPFEREPVEAAYAYGAPGYYPGAYPYAYGYGYYDVGFALGYGPHWWYDPWYPRYAFQRHRGVVVGHGHLPHSSVHVASPHGFGGGGHGGGGHGGGHH
jgi:hypothetical protein